ncbi:MAG: Ig-like domain-containing protein, partial [Candidatus Diapherotrites archaeon]|nr:Ig-like domain-containing protein [Candidatus Diapherotrites archaeon]
MKSKIFSVFVVLAIMLGMSFSFAAETGTGGAIVVNTGDNIKASSTDTAILGLTLLSDSSAEITSIKVTFAGTGGFDPSNDFAALGDKTNSGVSIYKDGNSNGVYDAGVDPRLNVFLPSWSGTGPYSTIFYPSNTITLPSTYDAGYNYFVVIKTSAAPTDTATFTPSIVSSEIVTTGTNIPASTITGNAVTIDTTAPTISSRVTVDGDGDGFIDAITITFSEDVDDSTVDVGDFAIGTGTLNTITSGTVDDDVITLDITDGAHATDVVPTVTYTAGTIKDLALNSFASNGPTAST